MDKVKAEKAKVEPAKYDRLGPRGESKYNRSLEMITTIHAENEDEQIEEAIAKLYKKDFGRAMKLFRRAGVREDMLNVQTDLKEARYFALRDMKQLNQKDAKRVMDALRLYNIDWENFGGSPVTKINGDVYASRRTVFTRNKEIKIINSLFEPVRYIRDLHNRLNSFCGKDGKIHIHSIRRQTVFNEVSDTFTTFYCPMEKDVIGYMYGINVFDVNNSLINEKKTDINELKKEFFG